MTDEPDEPETDDASPTMGEPDDEGAKRAPDDDETAGTLVPRTDGDGAWYQPPEPTRRNVAKWLVGISGLASIGSIAVSAVTGLGEAGLATGPSQLNYKTIYVKGTHLVDKNGNRLKASSTLPAGQGKEQTVLPEMKGGGALQVSEAVTLLLRFDQTKFESPTNVGGTADGYVAYSGVCTHEGCIVSGREGTDLHCPCHNSVYNPLKGATVVSGPAPRALPQLPIGVSTSGDLLVATGPFSGPIGPQ
ncbi:MAG: ubiquinol-cytochrome c reductase iron-sulfur subunit [Halorientalis sp.]